MGHAAIATRDISIRGRNNFDLIRLFAALQVATLHSIHHLSLSTNSAAGAWSVRIITWFPGVPIFFFVSGFLITPSLERSHSFGEYIRKRFLRIYPAMWCCFGVSFALLIAFKFVSAASITSLWLWRWIACQLTMLQSFNPPQFRGYGTGVVNGALWTIPVELSFYFLIALIYRLFDLKRRSLGFTTAVFGLFGAASLCVWIANETSAVPFAKPYAKVIFYSPLPHFWIWLMGAAAYKHIDRIRPLAEGKLLLWLPAYMVLAPILCDHQALMFPFLAIVTLSAAYSATSLSERLLSGNDISYGVYLYHMLAVNAFVALGVHRNMWTVIAILGCASGAAVISWFVVERPALRWKTHLQLKAATTGSVNRDRLPEVSLPSTQMRPPFASIMSLAIGRRRSDPGLPA